MNLRFVSWNIHGKKQISQQLDLLRSIEGDFVALQEVTSPAYQALVESKLFAWSAFSLHLRQPMADEGPGRRLGCVVCGQAPFRFKKAFLLEHAPLPERALIVEVETPTEPFFISSFHAPPGVTWKEKKPLSFIALAQWLAQHEMRVLVGMDANAPKTDHPDIEQNQWWWKDEPVMLGSKPLHLLRDALRIWLVAHPTEAEQLYKLSPQGPLALSFRRRGTRAPIPCRYDFIYITPDFSVSQVRYLYDEAISAGSDHAVVISDLTCSTDVSS